MTRKSLTILIVVSGCAAVNPVQNGRICTPSPYVSATSTWTPTPDQPLTSDTSPVPFQVVAEYGGPVGPQGSDVRSKAFSAVVTSLVELLAPWPTLSAFPLEDAAKAVDFTQNLVAVLYLGQKPSPGFRVDALTIRDDVGGTVPVRIIRFHVTGPLEGPPAVSYPYLVISFPRIKGVVRFEDAGESVCTVQNSGASPSSSP